MYVEEKKVFKKLLKKGFTTKVISEKIGVSVRTIERWRREARNGTLEHVKPARGRRPLKASIRELRYLRREADKDGTTSAKDLAARVGLEVSDKTARNYLKRTGLDSFSRPRMPSITKVNKRKRLAWARQHLNEPADFWERVVWTDETMVCLDSGYGNTRCWSTREGKYRGKNPVTIVKEEVRRRCFGGVSLLLVPAS